MVVLVAQSMLHTPLSEASIAKDNNEEIWYVDVKTTNHMLDNRFVFTNFKEVTKGTWLMVNGYCQRIDLWVLGIGDIKIKQRAHDQWLDGTFHEVLNIPYLRPNIFCIERVANRGMVTIYKKNKFHMIRDNGDGDIILT